MFSHGSYAAVDIYNGKSPEAPIPGPDSTVYDNSRLKNILGIKLIDVRKTLQDTIDNFKSHGWVA